MSNHPMANDDRTDTRLTELEIKLSYLEDTVERLNDVIVWMQAQIELLLRGVAQLGEQPRSDGAPAPHNPRDDLPPHY